MIPSDFTSASTEMTKNWYLTIFKGAEFKSAEKWTCFLCFNSHFLILKLLSQIFCLITMGNSFQIPGRAQLLRIFKEDLLG